MTRRLAFTGPLGFALLAMGQTAGAAVVFSDAFENPRVPVGSYNNYNPGQTFGPWTAVGAAPSSVVSGTFQQSGFTFQAQEGAGEYQWADLAGQTSNSTEGFRTTIATTPGDIYNVSFWVGNVVDQPGGYFGTTTTVNVFINDVIPAFSALNSGSNGNLQYWQQFNFDIVATGISTSFSFLSGDPATDYTAGLDNVVISSRPAAVPEPGTWAMMMLGLAGLGFRAFRSQLKGFAKT